MMKTITSSTITFGNVALVGAGPGDPDLLTMKAVKAIDAADVIIYDNLVSREIQATFPHAAQHVYVGKAKGHHSMKQEEINELIASYAMQGLQVCRVKGGDAFVFGRGGEEMLFLAQRGIRVEVVPGITAASGCSTYANIPLTHRGLAQGCTFITAHADKSLDVNWGALASLNQTLVIYMGLSKAQWIQETLIKHGMDQSTPVAIIENGCTTRQRTFTGELTELHHLATHHQVCSPALIVIGQVVKVASQMEWLEQLTEREAKSDTTTIRLTA
ncbi:uroporphyrinogen-III C-methyltransferase [Vibrio nitrifigilis]|nr:uroporphyrinogen-III C-methyltransferase [Vibrio nitrifigilis]